MCFQNEENVEEVKRINSALLVKNHPPGIFGKLGDRGGDPNFSRDEELHLMEEIKGFVRVKMFEKEFNV